MSEIFNNDAERMDALIELCQGLVKGGKGKVLVEKHRVVIDTVTPWETMAVLDKMLIDGFPFDELKAGVGKIINIFFKSLNTYHWEKPAQGHYLYYMMLENQHVKVLMNRLRTVTKQLFHGNADDSSELIATMRELIVQLQQYDLHYIKKENILFPYIEQTFPQYRCLQVMWAFHDDFRKSLKEIDELLRSDTPSLNVLNKELGKLFFVVLPIIFREEQIVFPIALQAVPEKEWAKMLHQSSEIGWCYIEPPKPVKGELASELFMDDKIDMGSGFLLPDQLKLMLNTLPLDITFIDEHDEVCYFSVGKERIFPRVNAIIGRKVQNCHPADSVHVVNQIIDAFRKGKKDHADFWIQMKARFIHIRYFAVRNDSGEYKGTIEMSQDITKIKFLEGDRKLLNWDLK